MPAILDGLNAAQRSAVSCEADVLQILAPPGSGKTKTLTSRVAYLLEHHGYQPCDVICLTFTNKSAWEMQQRLAKLLGHGRAKNLILGTFHAVCRRYLAAYGQFIGIPKGFGIADSGDASSIIKRIIKRDKLTIDPKKAQARISHTKSKGILLEDLWRKHAAKRNIDQEEFLGLFEAYEKQLANTNQLDFDDLLIRCADLLRYHPECVCNVEAVLVDEFQDTNVVQFELLKLFAARNNRISTVGDPDQSIYGWRSAEVKNLYRMQTDFPETLIINLEDNYRSSGAILLSAQEVIEQDQSRPQKRVSPTHCIGTTPVLRKLPSADVEAAWIVTEIQRMTALTGQMLNHSDFAILLRSAHISRLIEKALRKVGIDYRMVGGQKFYDRVEIKLLLDYLRVVGQPNNNDALARVVNVPRRGVGKETIKALIDAAEMENRSLWDLLLHRATTSVKISKSADSGISEFMNLINTARRKLLDTSALHTPEQLLRLIVRKLNFQTFLKKEYPDDDEARWANVEELIVQAAEFGIEQGGPDSNVPNAGPKEALPKLEGLDQAKAHVSEELLNEFLANAALAADIQTDKDSNEKEKPHPCVTISTIHAAKGLEWPVVFIASAYDGQLPSSRAEDQDEERRLLYVAMTRAQALLYMSCPGKDSLRKEEVQVCPYLTDQKVQKYLTNKGPSMGRYTLTDIGQILRRAIPSREKIAETSSLLKHVEDDIWPLDGTENIETVQARWRGKVEQEGFEHLQPQAKRLKFNNFKSVRTEMGMNIGNTTTMQGATSVSCIGQTSFISASTQMTYMTRDGSQAPGTREESRGPPSKNECASKTLSTQSDLRSLWKPEPPPKRDVLGRTNQTDSLASHSTNTRQESLEQREDLTSLPGPRHRIDLNRVKNHAFSSVRVNNLDRSGQNYVFLSSSPPPETNENKPAGGKVPTPAAPLVPPPPDKHMVVPRKTLGVRRSMAGWNPAAGPGFTAPRTINKIG